jgi:hypothetical protein
MKKLRICIILVISLALYGCKTAEEIENDKIDNLCNRVTFTTVSQLINAHEGLHSIGFGGGGALGINKLTIIFNYYKSIDVENARKLIVDCVKSFLININKEEELRPHLKVYPFKPANVEIDIHVLPGDKPLYPNIKTILFWREKIEYYYFSEKDSEDEKCIEESYETALEIVKKESEK